MEEKERHPIYPRPSVKLLDETVELIEAVINDTEIVYAIEPPFPTTNQS